MARRVAPLPDDLETLTFPDHPDRAWCIVDGEIVMLDLVEDRYFCLPNGRSQRLLEREPRLQARSRAQPERLPVPHDWVEPEYTSEWLSSGAFDLGQVARALWAQRRVEQRLAARGLACVIASTHAALRQVRQPSAREAVSARRIVGAFEQASLIRSAANRCLPRSIALALALTRTSARPMVVIGVKMAPFAAHCWVQTGQVVVSDTVEEVRRFTPILVL